MNRFTLFAFIAIGWVAYFGLGSPAQSGSECTETLIYRKGVSAITYKLEFVTTPEAREHGLMNRDKIGNCDGMAFIFPSLTKDRPTFTPQQFWMKDTRIPLDILFIDPRGKITAIENGVPQSLTPVGPDIPTATAIEIDAGRAAKDGIRVGDMVHYDLATAPHLLAR